MSSQNKYDFLIGSRDVVFDINAKDIVKNTKAVVFDLDGTLVDSIAPILSCTHTTFEQMQLPKPSDEAIMATIGLELQQGLTSLLPDDKKDLGHEVTKHYRDVFNATPEFKIDHVFDGVEDLFKTLKKKNIKIAFASGRSRIGVDRTIDGTFFKDYCDARISASDAPSKPDPTMMLKVCNLLNVSPNNTLGVGDSSLDIQMYNQANSMSLGVQTGVYTGDALKKLNPTMLLPKISDLTKYFES